MQEDKIISQKSRIKVLEKSVEENDTSSESDTEIQQTASVGNIEKDSGPQKTE